jgi:hypothetical protein
MHGTSFRTGEVERSWVGLSFSLQYRLIQQYNHGRLISYEQRDLTAEAFRL